MTARYAVFYKLRTFNRTAYGIEKVHKNIERTNGCAFNRTAYGIEN